MTRDLLIVSTRALTARDLGAAVTAVCQGQPWTVTDDADQFTLTYRERPLLRLQPSTRVEAGVQSRWQTTVRLVDEDSTLGLEVARAVAWEADGELVESPTGAATSSPRKVAADELSALLDFIAGRQADPATGTCYLGTDRESIRLELEELGDDAWPGSALVVTDESGRIVGATVTEADAELGRSWINGPWAADGYWDAVARPLVEAAVAQCPPEINAHEFSGDVLNQPMADLAAELGWTASVPNHVFVAKADAASDWPADDPRVRAPRPDDFDAIAPLHAAEFPDTYLSTRQMIDEGIAGDRITVVSEADGVLLGYAAGRMQPDGAGYLDFIAVTPEARGSGAGLGLMVTVSRRIMAAAPGGDVNLTVQDHRSPAIGLYRRLRFGLETTIVGYSSPRLAP
ncbi:MAG: GNAT family N-acetyltransferase [Micropruina sp.]